MDLTLICLIIFSIVLIGFIFILFYLRKLTGMLNSTMSTFQTADERVYKDELTSYELERLEREEQFDNRINRLKDELAQQQHIIRTGIIADELHPSVHNLPHDSVQTKYDVYPDMEVAE